MGFGKEKALAKFKNFAEELKIDIYEHLDLEQYLSFANGDSEFKATPICSLFPILISSYYYISDEELQKKIITVLTKLFN